jgi:hypothetical protein
MTAEVEQIRRPGERSATNTGLSRIMTILAPNATKLPSDDISKDNAQAGHEAAARLRVLPVEVFLSITAVPAPARSPTENRSLESRRMCSSTFRSRWILPREQEPHINCGDPNLLSRPRKI